MTSHPQPEFLRQPPSLPHGPAYVPYLPVAAKEPAVSVLCSFLLPGLGQFVNGDAVKGVVMVSLYIGAWFLFWTTIWILIGFLFAPVVFGTWVWSMVDAHAGARRWNARQGIVG